MSRLPRRAALLLPFALGGCSWFDSLFSDNKQPLEGSREGVVAVRRGLAVDPADRRVITLPPPVPLAEWPLVGGNAAHVAGHIATSGLSPAWRSSIGTGGGYRRKITAQPVVAGGRVFTMDSDGYVAGFDLASGSRQWRTDTQAEDDRSTNVGGGLAVTGNTVLASTGRAEILALDASTGAITWRKPLGAPARSAPTLAEGRLFVSTIDDRLLGLNAADGERQWAYQAGTSLTTVLSQGAPAYAEGLVVAGFGSGDIAAVRADSGALAWTDSLAASRGRNSAADIASIRAAPVVDRGRVFAIGVGGSLAALDLRSGRRLWEREAGGGEMPWLAGDWLFVLFSDQALAALGREDGRVRWLTELPRYDNPEKRRDPLFWTGPVLVNNKLVVAGTTEQALSVDPLTGTILGRQELRDSVTIPPLAAGGSLLILTDDGTLAAFR